MTGLPIDYRSRPWRVKYLTEETLCLNRWFTFGTFPDGSVGICDGTNDIMDYVPKEAADRICTARNAFCDVIENELGLGFGVKLE